MSARRILVRRPSHWPYLYHPYLQHFEPLTAAAISLSLAARPAN